MKNRIIKYLFFIILINIGTLACRKDKPIVISDCYDFQEELPPITYFSSIGQQYKLPTFNPNNSNEFICYDKDLKNNTNKLIKYNISTGIKTILAQNIKLISQPKWSKKDWIAFDNSLDYQIWIVKDNGDSLKQFTTNTTNLYPAWDNTGLNLLWQYAPVLASSPSFLVSKNVYNTLIDTIIQDDNINYGVSIKNNISKNNVLLAKTLIENKPHIAYTFIDNISFESVLNLEQEGFLSITGLTWSNNSEKAYFSHSGLFVLDIITKKYTLLMDYCQSKSYRNISCSSDGKYIIGERMDSYVQKNSEGKSTGEIVQNSSIYLINLETMQETKILGQ